MNVFDVIIKDGKKYRIIDISKKAVTLINCETKTMPTKCDIAEVEHCDILSDGISGNFRPIEQLTPAMAKVANLRYTMIAPAVCCINNKALRNKMIEMAAERANISKQTIKKYLWEYLVYQDVAALADKPREEKELNANEKTMRWALNKYFYTQRQNSLMTAYTFMLKERFCSPNGMISEDAPSYNQFKYFYYKTRKLENVYISRDGLKRYQANKRPLVGNGVQEYAPSIGTAFLDATVCDIYLVNDAGELVGRPSLYAAIDANTSLCVGYFLSYQSGKDAIQELLFTIHKRLNQKLPGIFVTDKGCEFCGNEFAQLTELGTTIINLPSYRPELKGSVEKFFDIVQNLYKETLKGKGVIMPDFQKRGSHDYRQDASLTLKEFSLIMENCVQYYNTQRIIQNYPYSQKMIESGIAPYAQNIWDYKLSEPGATLISTSKEQIELTLLPRTFGKFSRQGLNVNKLRYYRAGYTENMLRGDKVTVAYNPQNVGKVWLVNKDGRYDDFTLIESQYADYSLPEVTELKEQSMQIITNAEKDNISAHVELLRNNTTIASSISRHVSNKKNIRTTRKTELEKERKDKK